MRWLTRRVRDERGASAVLVGILMLVLVGLTALAVDVGAMYSERAQLQNAADAAARAAALECAMSDGCVSAATRSTATAAASAITSGNMDDGTSPTTSPPAFAADTVTVQTATLDMDHPLAAAIGFASSTVRAAATAKWERNPARATVVPFAIGECALPTSGDGTRAWFDIDFDNSCLGSVPGGFGWLYDDTNSCLKDIELLNFTTITTGEGGMCSLSDADLAQAASQLDCDLGAIPNSVKNRVEKLFHCFVGRTVLVPVFGPASECVGLVPAGKAYCISKFAAFEMYGLHVQVQGPPPSGDPNSEPGNHSIDICQTSMKPCFPPIEAKPPTWGAQGFDGRFIEFITPEDDWVLGPPRYTVRLID